MKFTLDEFILGVLLGIDQQFVICSQRVLARVLKLSEHML